MFACGGSVNAGDYANSSLITLPLLAIFIGRPLLLVKVVSREMAGLWRFIIVTPDMNGVQQFLRDLF